MDADTDFREISGLLADADKFRAAAAVALGAGAIEKIAAMTGLNNAAVTKAMLKLVEAGLVTKKATGYVFNFNALQALNREITKNTPKKPALTGLDRFIKDGRLTTYPSRPDDQMMVLEHIAELFEYHRPYPEKEVNEKLKTVNPDFASLRRYLFDKGFFSRERVTEKDGRTTTMYWRVEHL